MILLLVGAAAISCAMLKDWKEAHTPPDETCAHCHYGIYKNWKIAYRPYNEAIKREDYTPVHSQPRSAADVMMKKSHAEGKGDCSECHVVEPRHESLNISKIGANFKETTYQLCGRCHDRLFNEWANSGASSSDKSCLACHADERDRPAQDMEGFHQRLAGIEWAEIKSIKPAMTSDDMKKVVSFGHDVRLRESKVSAMFIITNTGAGHDLPADVTNGAFVLALSLKGASGGVVENREVIASGWGKPSIPSGKDVYIDIEMKPSLESDHILEVTLKLENKKGGKDASIVIFHDAIKVKKDIK